MVAVHILLAYQLHIRGGSTDWGAKASLEGCIKPVAGPVSKLSSAPVTLVCGHLLLMAGVLLGWIAAFCSLFSFQSLASVKMRLLFSFFLGLFVGELHVPALDSQMGLAHPSVPSPALRLECALCSLG